MIFINTDKTNSMPEQVFVNTNNIAYLKEQIDKLGWNLRGQYSAALQYGYNDYVVYEGAGYVHTSETETIGVAPTDASVWTQVMIGATGATGPAGPAGPAGPEGPGFNFMGTWIDDNEYHKNDIVQYNGTAYICVQAVNGSNVTPDADRTHWDVFVERGATGASGPQGPQGVQGLQGPTGATGATGAQGVQGERGPQGPTGATGATGATGPQGPQGERGPEGPAGPTGGQGAQGVQGPQGERGSTGATGATGPQGVQGPKGDKGDPGADGRSFAIKDTFEDVSDLPSTGAAGDAYMVGATPPRDVYTWSESRNAWDNQGPLQGPTGAQGERGPQGETGATGATGAPGPQGEQGPQGVQGVQGPKGDPGEQGPEGPAGPTGAKGATGSQGPKGDPGERGAQGPTGPAGPTGPQGPQGVQGPAGAGWKPRGSWTSGAAYAINDVVDYAGSSYICYSAISTSTESPALDTEHFMINAEIGNAGPQGPKGDKGATGAQGPQGVQGERGPQGPQGAQGPAGDPLSVLAAYPVGSIYMSVNSTNPSSLFGGIWSRFGQGRCLVGVNESDTDFSSAQKTGGEKAHTLTTDEMPSHSHSTNIELTLGSGSQFRLRDQGGNQFSTLYTGNTGGGGAHNNLQPYITVYMWRRTA